MGCASNDTPNRTRDPRDERIANIVLMNSPVAQQETYRNRSSSERLMSVMNGGTALKPLKSGGKLRVRRLGGNFDYLSSPFSATVVAITGIPCQTEAEKSFSETTTPRKP